VDPRIAAAVVDVFVYVVVLNLFVEYLPRVLSETFRLSCSQLSCSRSCSRSSSPRRTG